MLVLVVLLFVVSTVSGTSSDVGLNTVELIKNHGYFSENHLITTEDGYILTYQRLHARSTIDGKKPPVLVMHGLLSSAADFVNMGPKRGLGYILADAGYDVWLANARGTSWSRNHTTMDPYLNPEKFFDFSWHEIGYYDIPAAIDYILKVNGDDSLYYIGHSQGGTVYLVMASSRPEYNKKIRLSSLMAPASFMQYPMETLKNLSGYVYVLEDIAKKYRLFEVPYIDQLHKLLPLYCQYHWAICAAVFGQIGGNSNQDRLPVILSNYPEGAALKQFLHFFQLMRNGGFSWYDYRPEKNKQLYGSEVPPKYDLSKITAPLAIYYSKTDRITDYRDTKTLLQRLPNVIHTRMISSGFEHTDYLGAKSVVDLVYKELVSVMRKY